jgi:hypothetical protein
MNPFVNNLTFFSTIQSAFCSFGTFNGLLYLLHRAISRVSRGKGKLLKYYLVCQPVKNNSVLKKNRGKSITTKLVTSEDPIVKKFPRTKEVIDMRFDQGDICVCAFKNDTFYGYLWISLDTYHEDEVNCIYNTLPKEKTSWDYDVYIEPRYRLTPTFAKLWDTANEFLTKRKINFTVSRISAYTPHSLRSHSHLDASVVGTALFFSIPYMQIMFASCPPFISFSSNSPPTLTIDIEKKLAIKHTK